MQGSFFTEIKANKLSSLTDTLPQFKELGDFSANEYYYLYNNELSKYIGLDLSKYAEKDVTVDIYQLREGMPEKFYPIATARGIVVKYESEIIGAFISAGRHSVENACSLSGKSFDEKHKSYTVIFDAEYVREETISNGSQYWICTMVYKSDNTGWKIASVGH